MDVVKGRVSQDFLLQVFIHESTSPKPPKITLGSFQIFFKIHIRKWRCTTGVNYTGGKVATSINDTGGQILPQVLLVLLIPVAKLPPASTIPVENNWNNTADILK
jgi:hypothetical protein